MTTTTTPPPLAGLARALIAAGKVGEKAGKIFEKNFERPPTVTLASGTPIGVLILNVKDR